MNTSWAVGITALYVVLSIAAAVIIATRRHSTISCEDLVARLYPHQLRGKSKVIAAGPGRATWRGSGGMRGLWQRWRNRVVLVQLCQERGAMEPVPPEELTEILTISLALTRSTLTALALHPFSLACPQKAARAAHRALSAYVALALKTHALYSDDAAPLCATRLAAVL